MLERIETLLADEGLEASEWERSFLSSIERQLRAHDRGLSANQASTFERIEEQNSPDVRQGNDEFAKRWASDPQLVENTRIVCRYYEVTEYYGTLTYKILEQGYVPTAREYKKLCENKYALRVREEHFNEPRYTANSLVQVRTTNTINRNFRSQNGGYTNLKDAYALVIETDALPITRAAKGAKVYKILPVGANRTYYVSESDIKKARKVRA
jgi:hypothetical protein